MSMVNHPYDHIQSCHYHTEDSLLLLHIHHYHSSLSYVMVSVTTLQCGTVPLIDESLCVHPCKNHRSSPQNSIDQKITTFLFTIVAFIIFPAIPRRHIPNVHPSILASLHTAASKLFIACLVHFQCHVGPITRTGNQPSINHSRIWCLFVRVPRYSNIADTAVSLYC